MLLTSNCSRAGPDQSRRCTWVSELEQFKEAVAELEQFKEAVAGRAKKWAAKTNRVDKSGRSGAEQWSRGTWSSELEQCKVSDDGEDRAGAEQTSRGKWSSELGQCKVSDGGEDRAGAEQLSRSNWSSELEQFKEAVAGRARKSAAKTDQVQSNLAEALGVQNLSNAK